MEKIDYLYPQTAPGADATHIPGIVKHTRYNAPPLQRNLTKTKAARYLLLKPELDGLEYVRTNQKETE